MAAKVFDWLQAPFAGWGHFLGDYEGVAVDGHGFRPILIEANEAAPQNSTDAFSGLFASNVIAGRTPAPQAVPNRTSPPQVSAHRLRH
jgi:hypothetical protein